MGTVFNGDTATLFKVIEVLIIYIDQIQSKYLGDDVGFTIKLVENKNTPLAEVTCGE